MREESKRNRIVTTIEMQARTDGVFSGLQVFMNAALFRNVAAVVASVPFVVPLLPLIFAICRLGAAVLSSSL